MSFMVQHWLWIQMIMCPLCVGRDLPLVRNKWHHLRVPSLEQEWFLRAPALAAQACLDKVREKVGHSLLQFDFVIYILVLCLIIFWSSYRQIAHIAKRPPWAKLKLREPWKCTDNEHLFISNPGLSEHYLTLWSHVKPWEDESEGYLRRSWAPHLQGMWHRTPEWTRRHEYFFRCNMINRYILCILDHLCNACC